MNEVDEELGVIVRREFLGQTRPVLFESFQPLTPAVPPVGAGQSSGGTQEVIWSGLTDNYLRVLVHAPAGADLHNRILPTRLLGLAGGDLIGHIESEDWSTGVSR